jgi:hypothetical protein
MVGFCELKPAAEPAIKLKSAARFGFEARHSNGAQDTFGRLREEQAAGAAQAELG